MNNANLVATELHNAGFATRIQNDSVIVSLSNRKPSTMEVWITLRELFEEITFTVKSLSDSVEIRL